MFIRRKTWEKLNDDLARARRSNEWLSIGERKARNAAHFWMQKCADAEKRLEDLDGQGAEEATVG